MQILGLFLQHRGRLTQLRRGSRLFARVEYRGGIYNCISKAHTKDPDRFIEKPGDNLS